MGMCGGVDTGAVSLRHTQVRMRVCDAWLCVWPNERWLLSYHPTQPDPTFHRCRQRHTCMRPHIRMHTQAHSHTSNISGTGAVPTPTSHSHVRTSHVLRHYRSSNTHISAHSHIHTSHVSRCQRSSSTHLCTRLGAGWRRRRETRHWLHSCLTVQTQCMERRQRPWPWHHHMAAVVEVAAFSLQVTKTEAMAVAPPNRK